MVLIRLFGINIYISYFFLSLVSILIIVDKTGMLSLSLLSVVFHEIGHLAFMKILKVGVSKVELSVASVRVVTDGYNNHKNNFIVSIAGPIVNLCLSVFLLSSDEMLMYFGAANLIMCLFNMIPARGLDGGDAIYYLLRSIKIRSADKICSYVSFVSQLLLIAAGGVLFYYTKTNITLMLVGIYLFILSFYKI